VVGEAREAGVEGLPGDDVGLHNWAACGYVLVWGVSRGGRTKGGPLSRGETCREGEGGVWKRTNDLRYESNDSREMEKCSISPLPPPPPPPTLLFVSLELRDER